MARRSESGDQIAQIRLDDLVGDLRIAHLGELFYPAREYLGNLFRHVEPLVRGLAHQERCSKVHAPGWPLVLKNLMADMVVSNRMKQIFNLWECEGRFSLTASQQELQCSRNG